MAEGPDDAKPVIGPRFTQTRSHRAGLTATSTMAR
jgi:hypothetical protein